MEDLTEQAHPVWETEVDHGNGLWGWVAAAVFALIVLFLAFTHC